MQLTLHKQQNLCILCCKVRSELKTRHLNGDILELLTCLNDGVRLNLRALEGSIVCETCLEKINDACEFKILYIESAHRPTEDNKVKDEKDSTERIMCFTCKNNVNREFTVPILRSPYIKDIVNYLIPKEDSPNLENSCICDNCQISALKFHDTIKLLANYETQSFDHQVKADIIKNDVERIIPKQETVDGTDNIDILDNYIKETPEIKVEEPNTDVNSNKTLRIFINCSLKQAAEKHIMKSKIYRLSSLRCKHCPFQAKYKSQLNTHILKHERALKCILCEYSTKSEHEYKLHSLIHKKGNMFYCNVCGFETKYKSSLKEHMLVHKNVNEIEMLKCNVCKYQTKTKSSLRKHMQCHKTNYVKCEKCPFQTKYKAGLKQHMLLHKVLNENDFFRCYNCSFQTIRKPVLARHMLVHNHSVDEIQIFKCTICSSKFRGKESFEDHMLTHKNVKTEIFKCRICPFKARLQYQLKEHIRKVHTNTTEIEMFECYHCGHVTKRKDCLQSHIQFQHGNDVHMFKCNHCDYSTRYKHNFSNHMLRHDNTPIYSKYKCHDCQFQTKHKHYLRSHMRMHQSNEIFKCLSCEFSTKNKYNLKNHLKVHRSVDETEMFKCSHCDYQTKHKYYLNQHALLVHKKVW